MCPFLSVFLAASTSCTECPSAENITNSLRLVVSGMRHSVAQKTKKKKHFLWGTVTLGKLQGFLLSWFFQKNKNILNIFAISQTQGHFYYTVFLPGNSEKSLFIHCLFKKIFPLEMSRHDQELNQEGYIMQTKQKCFQAVCSFFFYP